MLRAMSRSLSLLVWLSLFAAAPVLAQEGTPDGSRDEEARSVFAAGNTAFEDARYGDALEYFQRAYELSGRPGLLYNIGVAADRLRQDEVALDAFERFLAEVPEHERRRDVEARVLVLRESVAARAASGTAAVSATAPAASSGPDVLTIVGASVLGAAGLAGVIAAIVGIAGSGQCLAMDGATCVEERGTNWVAVGVYGGLGLAGLAAAVVWLVVGLSGGDAEDAPVALTPDGLAFQWSL
jgi:tetratricopeptide (TPR) repeat protein